MFDYFEICVHGLNSDSDNVINIVYDSISNIIPYIMINELTKQQNAVIDLYIKGKNQNEIAKILHLTQSTVSRHFNAGKDRINNHLNYMYAAALLAINEFDQNT